MSPVNQDQQAHLELIQGVIDRMSGQSFFVKGWSVTLVAALVALAAKDTDRSFALICYYPCILFWCLDAYFLSQERRYRALYDWVRSPAGANTDFGMNSQGVRDFSNSVACCFFRPTVALFHLAILLGIVAVRTYFPKIAAAH